MVDVMELLSTDLEAAVGESLGTCGAEVEKGPRGEHDLKLRFRPPFVRHHGDGFAAYVHTDKEFVVEVKSHRRGGVKISDLRQLHDWVMKDTRRVVPMERQEELLHALSEAREDLRFWDSNGDQDDVSREEYDNLQSAYESLVDVVDEAVDALAFSVKGLLVINHHVSLGDPRPERWLGSNALSYARANRLAVISWEQLREVEAKVRAGALDPLNFWCPLFETSGAFSMRDYDWRERTSFTYRLFEEGAVDASSDIQFIDPRRW